MLKTSSVTGNNSYEHITYNSFTARIDSGSVSQLDNHELTDTSSKTQDLTNYYNDIKTYIYTFVPPVLITVSVFCNLLSLVVWVRGLLKKRGSSSSYFFICLAVARPSLFE